MKEQCPTCTNIIQLKDITLDRFNTLCTNPIIECLYCGTLIQIDSKNKKSLQYWPSQ